MTSIVQLRILVHAVAVMPQGEQNRSERRQPKVGGRSVRRFPL
jgi:hypothetical protein